MEKLVQKQSRATVFAHYDKNNTIQDYVIYYLKELKKVSEIIIFVSDTCLSENEINKISSIANIAIAKPHGEYDFGSYKIGFKYLEDNNIIDIIDELIFVNNSCFGPVIDIETLWENMKNKPCDFWGNSFNLSGDLLHVQSYFLVFKKHVFTSEVFNNFIHNITKQNSKDDIIKKYEIGLSQLLIKKNFLPKAYLIDKCNIAGILIFWNKMSPFIKISLAKKTYFYLYKIALKILWHKYKLKYPQNLIYDYLKQNKTSKKIQNNIKILREIFVRLRFKEKRCFFFGRWYTW